MGQTEIIIFIVLTTVVLLIFIGSILVFIFQYRQRKLLHIKEKAMIEETHQRELLNTQLQIQEQTMQDIGREIHDNVGQRLTLASIYVHQLLAAHKGENEQLSSVSSIINDSLAELRALSKSLVSTDANAEELRTLLERECERIDALGICEVHFQFPHVRFTISAMVKNFVVRIVQEAFQNSLKHSSCTRIELHVNYAENGLTIKIRDDGHGFQQQETYDGIGLQNMSKRASLIGAEYALESKAGQGVRINLFIPSKKLNAV